MDKFTTASNYLNIVYEDVSKSIRVDVPDPTRCPIADLGHTHLTLEAATDAIVDTLGLAPLNAKTHISITLMPMPLLGVLLHNFRVRKWSESHSVKIQIDS